MATPAKSTKVQELLDALAELDEKELEEFIQILARRTYPKERFSGG